MDSLGERLRAHWSAQGLIAPPGVTEERLREFESSRDVLLPRDLRAYFAVVDGMGSNDIFDHDFFAFWPLDLVVRVSEEYPRCRALADPAQFFIFADHSIRLPSFAIRLNPTRNGPETVAALYSDRQKYSAFVVADSFREFVERYLASRDSRMDLQVGIR